MNFSDSQEVIGKVICSWGAFTGEITLLFLRHFDKNQATSMINRLNIGLSCFLRALSGRKNIEMQTHFYRHINS
jgi:hypothetical protein